MTKMFALLYVDARDVEVDVVVNNEDQQIRISQHWLHFPTAHRESRCMYFRSLSAKNESLRDLEMFCCDHIPLRLYKSILERLTLPDTVDYGDFGRRKSELLEMVELNLCHMPRNISIESYSTGTRIRVIWFTNEPVLQSIATDARGMIITLHKEATCAQERCKRLFKIGKLFSMATWPQRGLQKRTWQTGWSVLGHTHFREGPHHRMWLSNHWALNIR